MVSTVCRCMGTIHDGRCRGCLLGLPICSCLCTCDSLCSRCSLCIRGTLRIALPFAAGNDHSLLGWFNPRADWRGAVSLWDIENRSIVTCRYALRYHHALSCGNNGRGFGRPRRIRYRSISLGDIQYRAIVLVCAGWHISRRRDGRRSAAIGDNYARLERGPHNCAAAGMDVNTSGMNTAIDRCPRPMRSFRGRCCRRCRCRRLPYTGLHCMDSGGLVCRRFNRTVCYMTANYTCQTAF